MAQGEIQILDFSTSQIVSIHTGRAKIQTGNFKLIHVIDLNEYEKYTDNLTTILNSGQNRQHSLFPYLSHELEQIRKLIQNLKPRKAKRSLNFVGSAWKWIAGNPDHDDFVTIEQKMSNMLENNNKQVVINNLYSERINNITKITNEIQKLFKEDKNFNNEIIFTVQSRLNLIKEELTNINHAIHWAKLGIINSLVLSKQEIKIAVETLDKENLPFSTIEDALNFSEIKIISNITSLLYIINIPITSDKIYEKLLLKPVKRHEIATEITYENVLRNNNEILGLRTNCKSYNYISICNQKDFVDLSNTSCIPNILKSLVATCNVINSQHIPQIEEISTGLVLLNNFNGTVLLGTIPRTLNGTFLIKFHNANLTIKSRIFISREATSYQILPAVLQPPPQENERREFLSLEMMNELHINNTNAIKSLQTTALVDQVTSYGAIIAIIASIILLHIFCQKEAKVIIKETETTLPKTAPTLEARTTKPSPTTLKFNDIPYF